MSNAVKAASQAGLFLFRRLSANAVEFLLLHTNEASGSCLGECEEPVQGALRITECLTGLTKCDIDVFSKYKYPLKYTHLEDSNEIDFFLGHVHNNNKQIVISDCHCDYKWMNLECACNRMKYIELKQMAKCYQNIIIDNKLGNYTI
ncbi:uncharacterized protein LOC126842436 [Adelges cooleyi]|uniref:uncharacterized protein LOC126842436 n=1 Tax=Adelges cooleyi TaxID=133065 RepID=UPI00217FBC64|nr:uncharacterized protein LOC126842436 [Adelges cooleyi]